MHIFNPAAAILLWSSFTAAGPLRRYKSHRLSYRQVAPFQNTTSSVEPLSSAVQVIFVPLTSTESSTTIEPTNFTFPLSAVSTEFKTSTPFAESASLSASPSSLVDSRYTISTPSASVAGANTITFAFTASAAPTATALNGADEPLTLTATSAISTTISPNSVNIDSTSTVFPSIPASRNSTVQNSSVLTNSAKTSSLVTTTFATANFSSLTTFLSFIPPLSGESDISSAAEPITWSRLFSFMNLTTEAPTANPTIDALLAISELSAVTIASPAVTAAPAYSTTYALGLETIITSVPKFTFTSSLPSSSPTPSSEPLTSPTSSEFIIQVPTVISALPTPSTISTRTYAQNLAEAENYNSIFLSLSASSPCAARAIACISGARATCDSGKYDLVACANEQQACFALPMNSIEGVYVGCANIREAERVLGLPDSLSVTIRTAPVVVATKTSISEAFSSATTAAVREGQAAI